MSLSMYINRSGIKGQQYALDIISNNIANSRTTGYKAKGVRFQSLIENQVTEDDVLLNNINPSIGAGVRSEVGVTNNRPGPLVQGANAYDLSIQGEGYFGVTNGNGDFYLTRDGIFHVDHAGRLVNNNGDYVVVNGTMPPATAKNISITQNGQIVGYENNQQVIYGTVATFMPENVSSLMPVGQNYYVDPTNRINAVEGIQIISNILEMSNVDLAQEITDMIVTQRAYDLNLKVTQGTDEMMTLINQFST